VGFFKQTIRDVPLDNQTVLVRVDYNLPMKDGVILDDMRVKATLPTINYLLERGCKIVIIAHLGRPEGKDPKFSLEPAAQRLAILLKKDIRFVNDCIGDRVYQAVKRAPAKSIIVLENLRFYDGEAADDPEFAKKIVDATGARYFVQDGFGIVHEARASTHAITAFLPSVAGLLVEREYTTITNAMESPKRPLIAVTGGAKVSDKIGLIGRFVQKADQIIVGGAMANTFLAYKGITVGSSMKEDDEKETLDAIYKAASKKPSVTNVDEFILLPTDVAVATDVTPDAVRRVVKVDAIGPDDKSLDIGDESIEAMAAAILKAKTVIWNGTLGMAEIPAFAEGSARLAKELATHPEITSIIGGGDTADFVNNWDPKGGASFTHVSTGGGASLQLMAGEKLPGVESLLDARP
jgi:phosphoglycerate kinase